MDVKLHLMALLSVSGLAIAQGVDASAVAKAAAMELGEGRLAALHARFAEDLKTALSEELLADPLVKDLVAGAGTFEGIEGVPACQAVQASQSCIVPMMYKLAKIRLRFTIDAAGRVAGMFVVGREAR